MYLVQYNIPSPGCEIAVKVVGVMATGLYTPSTLVTAIVGV